MPEEKESLIKFPCDFIIKVMGRANLQFEERVINIVLRHYPEIDLEKMTKRPSRDNNFVAFTFTVHAKNKVELDALYQELSAAEEVLFAL
ncbi:MAG: DUF493 domain-containing protein [Coxiellaceae bacterium]|nr:DUF493 domain-containing protein [Coxiellaceae bacterium]